MKSIAAVALAFGLLVGVAAKASGSGRAGVTYREYLETLSGAAMGYTLQNLGDTHIRLVALRGVDFSVASVVGATATSGPAPQCSISGIPATLRCSGFDLPKRATLIVKATTSGSGSAGQRAVTDGSEPTVTSFFPILAQQAQPRGTYSLKRLGKKRARIMGSNTAFVGWTRVRVSLRLKAHARVTSFKVGRQRSFAALESGCESRMVGGTTTNPSHQELDCAGRVDPGWAFFMVIALSGRSAKYIDDLSVRTADGRTVRLDEAGR